MKAEESLTLSERDALFLRCLREFISSAIPMDKMQSMVNEAVGEVTRTIHEATEGVAFSCHHPDPEKDVLVQRVITYLAKPGVVRSINNACRVVGGKLPDGSSAAPWLYPWCHRHETDLATAIDIGR